MQPRINVPLAFCDECGFDPARWTRQDAVQTMAVVDGMLAAVVTGMSEAAWNLDADGSGSAEAVVSDVTQWLRRVRERFSAPASTPMAPTDSPPNHENVVTRFAAEAHACTSWFRTLRGKDWDVRPMDSAADHHPPGTRSSVQLPDADETSSPDDAVRTMCHGLSHALDALADHRAVADQPLEPMTGSLEQISASGGGVPKSKVERASIDASGVVGDTQSARRHHGRPWQAVCLYSADVIDALCAEGHPISAGATGENFTIRGIDWSQMRGGLLVDVGPVRLRVSAPAVPCAKNHQWFLDGDSKRMHHDLHPGWSRWYATVLRGGEVTTGERVQVHASRHRHES